MLLLALNQNPYLSWVHNWVVQWNHAEKAKISMVLPSAFICLLMGFDVVGLMFDL